MWKPTETCWHRTVKKICLFWMVLLSWGGCNMTVAALTTKATLTESLRANLSVINVLTESHRSVRDIIWHLQPWRQITRWPVCSCELGFIKYRCNFSFFFFSTFQVHFVFAVIVITMPTFVSSTLLLWFPLKAHPSPLPRCSRIVLIGFFARTLNTLRKSIFFNPAVNLNWPRALGFFCVCACVSDGIVV